jgi:hypothetical protein
MIDDDREIGMAFEHRQQRLELARLHQSIEAQTQLRQCRQGRLHVGSEDPFRISEVLKHRPYALQQRVGGERAQRRYRIRRRQVGPADDCAHQPVAPMRNVEQVARFADRRRGLHQHRRANACRSEQGPQIVEREVAIDRRQFGCWSEPTVIATLEPPNVVMRVDACHVTLPAAAPLRRRARDRSRFAKMPPV